MSDKELMKFTNEFRRGILQGKVPNDKCFMVSAPLASLLSVVGVECQPKEYNVVQPDGDYQHWVVALADGRIIDPTASQFVDPETLYPLPKIIIGSAPKFYTPEEVNQRLNEQR